VLCGPFPYRQRTPWVEHLFAQFRSSSAGHSFLELLALLALLQPERFSEGDLTIFESYHQRNQGGEQQGQPWVEAEDLTRQKLLLSASLVPL
jgi:hypothetical protein